jgi:hypothetical protein
MIQAAFCSFFLAMTRPRSHKNPSRQEFAALKVPRKDCCASQKQTLSKEGNLYSLQEAQKLNDLILLGARYDDCVRNGRMSEVVLVYLVKYRQGPTHCVSKLKSP